ncbi:MAG: ABC transporter permease [Oscillospiraceae bacterium]
MKKKRETIKAILLGIILPVLIVLFWWYATNFGSTPESILPRISTVLNSFKELVLSGELAGDLIISLTRVLEGFAVAALLGVFLGTVMGMSTTVLKIFQPTVTTVRQIPIMAWIPLLILWCGIGELSKIVIIVIAAFFPVMVNTLSGISSTPLEYVEVAKMYKLNRWSTFIRVYLPHALPHIQTGLKLGLGVSWMAVVAAELIASTSGIGYKLSYARTMMRSDIVIVDMIVIGVIGILMDKVLSLVFELLTPWERKRRERG